jgi:hypothetical protein
VIQHSSVNSQLWTSLIFIEQHREKKLKNSPQLTRGASNSLSIPSLISPGISCTPNPETPSFAPCCAVVWHRYSKMALLAELCLYKPIGLPKSTSVQRLSLVNAASTYSIVYSSILLLLLLKCPNLAEFVCDDHLAAEKSVVLPFAITFNFHYCPTRCPWQWMTLSR